MNISRIAVAGNPNCGKSTIFNNLTGIRQQTGNYPGVTVEKHEGILEINSKNYDVVDLPGIYNLTPDSPEEVIARNELFSGKIDLVVNVVDAQSLERNLYLTIQLLETGLPLIIVVNMVDTAESRGIKIDTDKLSELLKVPVVSSVAYKDIGTDLLKEKIAAAENKTKPFNWLKHCDSHFSEKVAEISSLLSKEKLPEIVSVQWFAVKMLERDFSVLDNIGISDNIKDDLVSKVEEDISSLEDSEGETSDVIVASQRYGFINSLLLQILKKRTMDKQFLTDKVDFFVTHRLLGIPLFLVMMFLVFKFTFTVGDPFMGFIETFFEFLSTQLSSLWPEGSESFLKSLLIDGIIGGVGGVLVFLPNIILLFFAISILEGTGYMARIAFIMDRFMNKIGLHGKSFIPMIIGFGCTVPAIMATRTLESEKDRITTIMVAPLMSCGARLPIYALIIPAFYPEKIHATVMMTIYLTGVILAIISARVLRGTIFKGETSALIMELPPYRIPTFKSILIHMWEKAYMYLKKAGTVILFISVILWAAATFPVKKEFSRNYEQEQLDIFARNDISLSEKEEFSMTLDNEKNSEILVHTLTGRTGKLIEPLLKPLGFDWKIATALIGAFTAKEVFVSQMGIVYSVGEEADEESESLREVLKKNYNQLQAFCIMLFCLISVPCVATFAVTKKETASWKWPFFQLLFLTALAYVLTLIVYQSGLLLGIGV